MASQISTKRTEMACAARFRICCVVIYFDAFIAVVRNCLKL